MSFAQKSRRETVKTRYTVTLAMTASFVLGALAAQTLHAQATRPAYVVTTLDIHSRAGATAVRSPNIRVSSVVCTGPAADPRMGPDA